MMKSPKPVDSERVTPVQDSSILESKPLQTSSPPDPLPELADKERTELIQKFAKSVGCDQVSSTYWAFLWLQDIESLRRNVNLASISNVNAEILMQCSLFEQSQRIWQGKTRCFTDPETSAVIPSKRKAPDENQPTRDRTAKKTCMERDGARCVITGRHRIQVAHIVPFACYKYANTKAMRNFWTTLKMFWSEEKIGRWKSMVSGASGTEICENLLCLSSETHEAWTACSFALEPVEIMNEGKTFITRFYWLPRNTIRNVSIHSPPTINLLSSPDQIESITIKYSDGSIHEIQSGDQVAFHTADPITHPLPSWDLMSMQWTLHRICALSGAAETMDDGMESDSDNGFAFDFDYEEVSDI
ncbi:unnamed protein product [Penicillium camemberti]|uniref:Str. FM013 n=1 Tax=Penicillium camemberti (strain FM 013) TaxID=1429867 RepID=A0A0G4P6Z1_PENC3|nr:unnamed protein product [Penicillium camemberti]